MVEDLLEIEVAARLLESSEQDVGEDPIDVHYKKLATDIVPVERDSEEFALVEVGCEMCVCVERERNKEGKRKRNRSE